MDELAKLLLSQVPTAGPLLYLLVRQQQRITLLEARLDKTLQWLFDHADIDERTAQSLKR